MRGRIRSAIVAVAIASVGFGTTSVPAAPGTSTRVSQGAAQANGPTPPTSVPDTTTPDLSLDGLTLAFASDASNIARGDTNGVADVFIRSRKTGAVYRASTTKTGIQANGASYSPSLSVDGRWLAFVSEATNLVAGDTNGVADVFLKDLRYGTITRISVSSSGAQANGASNSPFVSLYGTFVTFESAATNLAAGDTNGLSDAFVRDVNARKTYRVTPPPIAQDADQAPEVVWSMHATISYTGRFVAYGRGATRDSVERPTALDVFIWDRATNKHTSLYVAPWAGSAKSMNEEPFISADGRYVAFTNWSVVNNDHTVTRTTQQPSPIRNDDALVRNPFDFKDIMVYDQVSKTTIPVSQRPLGVANGDSYDPQLSANGHVVAFVSEADNLVASDTNNAPDVFVRDLVERTTSRASLVGTGWQSNGPSSRPSLSYEGRNVVFASTATNIVPGDTNNASDLFWRDRRTDTPNSPPKMKPQFSGVRGLNQGESTALTLAATDPDRDTLRFGVVAGMPPNATLDPVTGRFSWTAMPDPTTVTRRPTDVKGTQQDLQHSDAFGGRDVWIVFWVQDPRGASDYILVKYFVRDAQRTARCRLLEHACFP